MKIKNIFCSIGLVALFASCDYLDIKPVGRVIPEKTTEFRALMVSAYNTGFDYKYLLSLRADEVIPPGDAYYYTNLIDFATWNDNSPNMSASYPWSTPYKAIFYTNSVLADVMNAEEDTDADSREQILGEAYLLRAYLHFDLLNLYGAPYNPASASTDEGIPLALEIDIEQTYRRATVEQVYAQVFSDIERGRASLTVDRQPVSTSYRFSRLSADAFEARVRLYHQDWSRALELAESVIASCPLEDLNVSTDTLPYDISSSEAILCLEKWGNYDIENYTVVLPNLSEKYDAAGDLRYALYFTQDADRLIPSKGASDDRHKVAIRSAEMYLVAAEAAAHLDGQLEKARTLLKELMSKRLAPDYYAGRAAAVDAMTADELLREIMDERARELALEGHRWFDLRRTTRPEIVKRYTDDQGQPQTVTLSADDLRYTVSLPTEATESNPNLSN